jgi:hypothetical protein
VCIDFVELFMKKRLELIQKSGPSVEMMLIDLMWADKAETETNLWMLERFGAARMVRFYRGIQKRQAVNP